MNERRRRGRPSRSEWHVALLGAGALSALLLGMSLLKASYAGESPVPSALRHLFALCLLAAVLLLAASTGRRLLQWLDPGVGQDEFAGWLNLTIGLPVMAYQVLALGLVGLLTSPAIGLLLLGSGLLLRSDLALHVRGAASWIRRIATGWIRLSVLEKAVAFLLIVLGAIAVLRALAPPSGYDALMYHLEGPRLFLSQQRIASSLDRWYLNTPLTTEMLFLLGLAFGSEVFAQLIDLTWGVLLGWGTWLLCRSLLGRRTAWIALGVLFSVPAMASWSSIANTDFAGAGLQLASVACLVRWFSDRNRQWLPLAGVFAGFAMGTKYLSFVALIAMASLVFATQIRWGVRNALHSIGVFILISACVASPWYLKNAIGLDDPLFPFLGGGERLDPSRMELFAAYVDTYRGVSSFSDWLALPVRLYTTPELFSEIEPQISIPSPLFLITLIYPIMSRHRVVTWLIWLVLAQFVMLSLLSLTMRFLLPLFPLLAIGGASVLAQLDATSGPLGRLRWLVPGLLLGSLCVVILLQGGLAFSRRVPHVLLGLESEADYLARNVPTYRANLIAHEWLPAASRMLTTGDGRTYYCRERCLDTDDQFLWVRLLNGNQDPAAFQRAAAALGATHVLVSWQDLDFFDSHGPVPGVPAAIQLLTTRIIPSCGKLVYSDPDAEIYELVCG